MRRRQGALFAPRIVTKVDGPGRESELRISALPVEWRHRCGPQIFDFSPAAWRLEPESPRLRTGRLLRWPLSRQAPVQFRYRRVVHRRSTRPASMFTPGRGRRVQATIRCAINSAPDRAGGHPVGRERTPSPLRSDPRRDAKPRGARSRDLERQLERCLQICQVNLSILYSLERRVDSVFSKRGSEARAARDRRLCPSSPFPPIRPNDALPRGADRRDARRRIAFP